MLARQEIIPNDDAVQIIQGLKAVEQEIELFYYDGNRPHSRRAQSIVSRLA